MASNKTSRKERRSQQPVKVLFINPFSSLTGGDLSFLAAVTGLDKQRFVPSVLIGGDGPLADRLWAAGLTVERHDIPYMSHHGQNAVRFVKGIFPGVLGLTRYIRQGQFDLVYNNSLLFPHGALAARLANVPCVWHVREMGRNPLLRLGITRVAGFLADRLVVVSRAVGNMFSNSTQKKIRLVYNGIDPEYFNPKVFDPLATRDVFSIQPLQPVVGYIGRLHPSKRPHDLLHAMAVIRQRWPDCLLLIAGEGELQQSLQETIHQLGLDENVRFLDYVSDVREMLSAIDVLTLPSNLEPFGRVLIEAMAMAKPVVATAAGGIPEIVTSETGRLVSVGQPQELAEAISFILEDRERAKELGRRGRERVLSHFSLESYVQGLEGVMMEMLSKRYNTSFHLKRG
jgi:glycosyltransferase involved in cell wall biosynthesis